MKRAIALIVFAAVLLLAGCGHAKDPFVGTWRTQTNDGPIFVISKAHSGYLVVADDDFKGVGVVDGHGDTLTVNFAISTGPPAQIETIRLTVGPRTRLRAIDEGVAGQTGRGPLFCVPGLMGRATLVNVSSTTTAPIPTS
jgi:hypothetical protein